MVVKSHTLGLGSDRDLRIMGSSPVSSSERSRLETPSLSLCTSPTLSLSLSSK